MSTRTAAGRRVLAAGAVMALGLAVLGALGAAPPASAEAPADYAQATFDAWVAGDQATLEQRAEPAVAAFLLSRAPGDQAPADPLCEGAAGSTYCGWTLTEGFQLLLRVDNAAASADEPRAVGEAAFVPAPDGIAVWPLTTQEEADNTQASVDEGHSPWMLDPDAVIVSYAGAELGWAEEAVAVEPGDEPSTYRLENTDTGLVVDVELSQPARTGEGGIWVVTRAGVTEPAPAEPPPTEPPGEAAPPETTPPGTTPPAQPVPGGPSFTG